MQPDYKASVEDHGAIRIAICKVKGQNNVKLYDRVRQKIEKHKELNVSGRKLRMKYVWEKGIDGEWLAASSWGDVQLYRRPLGLIYVAECKNAMDVALLVENYIELRKKLGSAVFDSRCLIFGVSTELLANTRPDILQFQSVDAWKTSWKDIEDLVTSIYFVLESKRVERSSPSSTPDKLPLLMAPFERKDTVNQDIESRSFRKKLQGRLRKHIGDLCLLAGMPQEALTAYHSALDVLRISQDHLWIAACLESLCAVTAVYSLNPEKPESPILKFCLETPNDIFEKYREAVINYSKYKEAGVLELEACLKATKVLAAVGQKLEASDFLQNTIYIGIKLPPEREIERLSTLAELYGIIGFKRKEAFYKRVAAMYCVTDQLDSGPRWSECYKLLTEALPGFNLNNVLNFIETNDNGHMMLFNEPIDKFGLNKGWPAVQARVLHELAFSARKMGNTRLAVKLLSGLLHNTHQYLNKAEQEEMLQALANYSHAWKQKDDHKEELLKDAATLPLFQNITFQVAGGDANLEPHSETQHTPDGHVFIYSPFEKRETILQWVKSESNSVELTFQNPLEASLKIHHVSLIVNGDSAPFVTPVSFQLDAKTKRVITIQCKSEIVGEFNLYGYRIDLYGLVYEIYFEQLMTCRRDLKLKKFYTVQVIDAIPAVNIDFSITKNPLENYVQYEHLDDKTKLVRSSLFDGEQRKFTIAIENISQIPIARLEITVVDDERKFRNDFARIHFRFNEYSQTLLPGEKMIIEGHMMAQIDYEKKEENLTQLLNIKYKEFADSENFRTHTIRLMSTIVRPLDVIGLCVKQSDSSDFATIVFEVRNKSNTEFEIIQSTKSEEIDSLEISDNLEGSICARATKVPPYKPTVINVQIEKLENIPIAEQCMEEGLGLRWRCGTERYGKLRLSSSTLNAEELEVLQASPLYWETEADGIIIEPGDYVIKGEVLQCIKIKTTTTNRTSSAFSNVKITVEAFQEDSVGVFTIDEGVICWVGLDCALQPEMEPQNVTEYSPAMLPLYAGEFKIRFKAMLKCSNDVQRSYFSPSYTFNISHPATEL